VVKWLFQKDTEVENRRRAAGLLATKLSNYGLKRVPALLICYSVGDYSGLFEGVREIFKLFLEDEDALMKELDGVFESVLAVKLNTEQGRAYLAAKLAEYNQPTIAA